MKFLNVSASIAAALIASACEAQVSAPATAAATTSAAQGADSPLERVIDLELVGGNVEFFEAISGPAKRVWDSREGQFYRSYEVNGCDVDTMTEGETIKSITLHVSQQCDPGGFGMQFAGKTLSEAEAELGGGRYVAGCISGCGNAADPTYGYEIAGYRANGFLNYSIQAMPESDADWDRLFAWKDQMVAERGEDFVVMEMGYQCDPAFAQGNRTATKDFRIVSVTVSSEPEGLTCR